MRLFTRLLIGHTAPVLIVTVALALTLISLLRMTAVLQTISDTELVALHRERELHRACWSIDVTMRRWERTCGHGGTSEEARRHVSEAASSLREVVQRIPDAGPGMRRVADKWLLESEYVLSGDSCENLRAVSSQQRRAELDDRLTDLWAQRLGELHAGLAKKDEQAQAIGKTAVTTGTAVAAAAFLLAMLLARRMARMLNGPLARLAAITRRVGRGDFSAKATIEGPQEIRALGEEVERMRGQLAELEMLKQGFLASVSHELRTPLSKIREALSLLGDGAVGPLDARQSRVVEIARIACEREIRMVSTLLDFSRLRTGSPLRLRGAVSVDAVIRTAVDDEATEAATRGVRIDVRTEGEAPSCRLDAALLERAIANLVRNAVSVSQAGQDVVVERTVHDNPDAGERRVCITVTDRGPGVPEDIRETVFNAFVTSAVPRSPKALGIGLGLALAREVALAHGGTLELAETERGASFHLWLPLDRTSPQRTPSNPTRILRMESTRP